MNLFPYILGPVWVLDVTRTSDGHTIAAWRCKMGGEPQQTVYDAAAVAKGVAVVTVSGHGTIVKPADSQLAARVRDDRATFLWSEHDGRIAFVRRERLQGMLTELSEAGIHPQRIEVSAPPDTAAGELLAGLGWRQLLRPTAEGSSLAQAVVRRAALPVLEQFLQEGRGWTPDNIGACLLAGRCYARLEQPDEAMQSLFRSFCYGIPQPEICCEIGGLFLERQQYPQAAFWYHLAIETGHQSHEGFWRQECCDYLPAIQLCVCYDRMGDISTAAAYNALAGSFRRGDAAVAYNRQYFAEKAARRK